MRINCAVIACLATSSAFLPLQAATQPGSSADLRPGFFLLHEVCHEESQVHLIALVKTTPPDVVDFVDRVSKLADQSLATLDRLSAHDGSLRDTTDPLPSFERATRTSIRADKQHLLLWQSKGATFTRRLLFTQVEAANYIGHLTKVWAERDPDKDRDATMNRLSTRWFAMRQEAFRMLDRS